jgi:hypothetical protein
VGDPFFPGWNFLDQRRGANFPKPSFRSHRHLVLDGVAQMLIGRARVIVR